MIGSKAILSSVQKRTKTLKTLNNLVITITFSGSQIYASAIESIGLINTKR